MTKITIKTGAGAGIVYALDEEKTAYLLKFLDSISEGADKGAAAKPAKAAPAKKKKAAKKVSAKEAALLEKISRGLAQVKQTMAGELPRRTVKQMIDGK